MQLRSENSEKNQYSFRLFCVLKKRKQICPQKEVFRANAEKRGIKDVGSEVTLAA